MPEPTIPPPMSTTSAVCMRLAIVNGERGTDERLPTALVASVQAADLASYNFCHTSECRCQANPNQHHNAEPAKHYGERGPTFDLADAGDADSGQRQGPDSEDVKRCQQAAEHRMRGPVDEISGIGGHGVLEGKCLAGRKERVDQTLPFRKRRWFLRRQNCSCGHICSLNTRIVAGFAPLRQPRS